MYVFQIEREREHEWEQEQKEGKGSLMQGLAPRPQHPGTMA